jgi:uncharacterized membrane protein YkvI
MSGRPDPTGIGAGVFFLLVGVVFLLDELDVWTVRLSFVLPLLLIGVGLALVLGWAASAGRDA